MPASQEIAECEYCYGVQFDFYDRAAFCNDCGNPKEFKNWNEWTCPKCGLREDVPVCLSWLVCSNGHKVET